MREDVDVRNEHSSTAVHDALDSRNLDIAQLHISHGMVRIQMPMINVDPETPLHRAVRSQKLDLVRLVLKGSGDVDVRGMYIWTRLRFIKP